MPFVEYFHPIYPLVEFLSCHLNRLLEVFLDVCPYRLMITTECYFH